MNEAMDGKKIGKRLDIRLGIYFFIYLKNGKWNKKSMRNIYSGIYTAEYIHKIFIVEYTYDVYMRKVYQNLSFN